MEYLGEQVKSKCGERHYQAGNWFYPHDAATEEPLKVSAKADTIKVVY